MPYGSSLVPHQSHGKSSSFKVETEQGVQLGSPLNQANE